MKPMILSVMAKNNSGVIARVSSLFTRRGFTITSFTGEDTHEPTISRLTVAVTEEEQSLLQIQRQLEKLEDIKDVIVLDTEKDVIRELALIKVSLSDEFNNKIKTLTQKYDVSIIDVNSTEVIFQICSTREGVESFIEEVRPYGICESVRTGVVALATVQN
ncbi:MAG: acetolactate synthase small subunit [Epulopiscium sp. Nuni2H_MBin001]|nr:MAG: acetolactate synthase small subunit [Epulopiscium sp. Nuni2H_MBin001]